MPAVIKCHIIYSNVLNCSICGEIIWDWGGGFSKIFKIIKLHRETLELKTLNGERKSLIT